MKFTLKRETVLKISWVIDNCLPPIVRDRWPFGFILMRTVYGVDWKTFYDLKSNIYDGRPVDEYYNDVYRVYGRHILQGQTDLNQACVKRILESLYGESFADVGCGRGYLANLIGLTRVGYTYGVDILEPDDHSNFLWVKGSLEDIAGVLHVDTVICSHTLEHVVDIFKAVELLKGMARERLIVVLPKQRPYNYHANPHLWFFPYRWNVLQVLRPKGSYVLEDIGGDWFYLEDIQRVS